VVKGDVMKIIKAEYETEMQLKTLNALVQSFEDGGVNIDKFIIWTLKNYKAGNSICLRMIQGVSNG
jgi:hypothetical protein